jgi:hypothetical protein
MPVEAVVDHLACLVIISVIIRMERLHYYLLMEKHMLIQIYISSYLPTSTVIVDVYQCAAYTLVSEHI